MTEDRKTELPGLRFHVPFLVGDALLVILGWLLFVQGHRPLTGYEVAGVGFCVAFGAWLGVWPFVLRHRAAMRRMETDELTDTVARIRQIDEAARRVEQATNKWQTAQDAADRTAKAAREIAEGMAERQAAFQDFMAKADDRERRNLRLEVEKLRQSETTWLQVLVFIMDHVYALHSAAERSGQHKVAVETGRFQATCLDAVRRVGLTRLDAAAGAPFDPEHHNLPDAETAPAEGEPATVVALLAPGYAFQGRLLRKPLVTLRPLPEPEILPEPNATTGARAADTEAPTEPVAEEPPAASEPAEPEPAADPDMFPEADRAPETPPDTGDRSFSLTSDGADASESPPSPS